MRLTRGRNKLCACYFMSKNGKMRFLTMFNKWPKTIVCLNPITHKSDFLNLKRKDTSLCYINKQTNKQTNKIKNENKYTNK